MLTSAATLAFYAHELQQALRMPVEVGNFVAKSDTATPLPSPCSVVGVRPYSAGGTRKLVLNAASPLVSRCAVLCAVGSGPKERYAAIALGTAMMETSNWPMMELDSPVPTNQWNRVLNCGPMTYHICPMSLVSARQKSNGFHSFLINYKRLVSRSLRESKDLKVVHDNVETIGDRLSARDDALTMELIQILESANLKTSDLVSSSFSNLFSSLSASDLTSKRTEEYKRQMTPLSRSDAPSSSSSSSSFFHWPSFIGGGGGEQQQPPFAIPEDASLLTYSAMLPVLLRAFAFASHATSPARSRTGWVPYAPLAPTIGDDVLPADRLACAFHELGTEDRLFCLSLWFRIPLIDRTGILQGPLRVAIDEPYDRPMVTKEEVAAFKDRGTSLEEACMERARRLWAESEEGEVSPAMLLQLCFYKLTL